jgi:type VI secretion system secreted protein Hcp
MPIEGFLKVEGIEGECKDIAHPGWIDVNGFEWGLGQEARPGPDGSLVAGTPTVRSVRFSQQMSRASPRLFEACCVGRGISSMTFEGRLQHGDEPFVFMRADFKDCLVTSFDASSSGGLADEQVEVVFRSVNVQTKERPLGSRL